MLESISFSKSFLTPIVSASWVVTVCDKSYISQSYFNLEVLLNYSEGIKRIEIVLSVLGGGGSWKKKFA